MTNDSEIVRPLNNLIGRMPEFEHFTAVGSKRWTLPMAAAWFIWRDFAAVDDQWKILTGAWAPQFDPPIYILSHHRQQPGTLTCVFQQAGFACGERPYVRLQDIRDPPSSETKTADPYDRLRFALQLGRLRATVVEESLEEGGLTESDWFMDDWLDFDTLADPSSMDEEKCHPLSDPTPRGRLRSPLSPRRPALPNPDDPLGLFGDGPPPWTINKGKLGQSVREDITLHSEGIILIAKKAQKKLESWGKEGLEFFDFLAPDEFLSQEPKATLWWMQHSIYILSHYRPRGKLERFSFGRWLVPYIEDDVLHFDVIAGITADALHRMRGLRDPVAEAWRKVRVDAGENWAERLAQAAKCSVAKVYSRRDVWSNEIGINIAFPLQLVIDVLHFGQASTARPENVAKMLAAVKAENGAALLKLYTEALADFEQKRLMILNPALLARPRLMPLEAPPSGPSELDDGGGEPEDLDVKQINLIEEGSDSEPPLESPTSSPSGVDDDGDEPEDPDFLPTGFIEEESDSEVEASRPSTFAKPKPTSPQVKATSKLGEAKLGKKSPNPKGAAPPKLGRSKPFSKS